MKAETDVADRGASWALGCLWAVLADRVTRDRWFLLGLLAMPALALCLIVPMALLTAIGAKALGLPNVAFVPIMLLGPIPFAWVLGRMRPAFPPALIGTIGFLIHQSMPLIAMWAFLGVAPVDFWTPNVVYYNMPAFAGLFASWLVWLGGTWAGSITGYGKVGRWPPR